MSRRGDSNPQPPDYKSGALPVAPRRRDAGTGPGTRIGTSEGRLGGRRPTASHPSPALPFLVAATVTVGLHVWRRNALISILAGTAVHVALATLLAGT